MTDKPKPPNAGKGRKPGVPNRATAAARNVFQALLDANQDKLQTVLDEAYEDDKARWWGMMMDLSEYCVPKLARTEIAGDPDGKPIFSVKLEFVQP